ncbi:MAG: SDR family oxidoreductase [Chlorobiaceae bacterium]|nr:SDR family oxidoreductase [Chlorobiaceae bacterium]
MIVKTVLVAGAAGYLGRYVAVEFRNRGYRVRAFVRDAQKLKYPGNGLSPAIDDVVHELFVGDATRPEALHGLCDGVDIVFSSMGLTHPDRRLTCEDVDHLGNRNILDLALRAKARKFVYVSVFRPGEMTGSDVVRAHEGFVDDLQASGIDFAVIRPNAYFSDMAQFLKLARAGHMFWLGDGSGRINPIHGEDLAMVCVNAAEGAAREIEVGGPEMFTYRSLFELAFETVGKEPRITFIPLWIGETALAILRIFSPKLAGSAAFFVQVNKMDNDAPPYGSHRLKDYFRQFADANSGNPKP